MSHLVELNLTSHELLARLALLPDSFYLRSEGQTYCGAFADAVSHELDPSQTRVTRQAEIPEHSDVPRWVGALPYEAFRGLERRAVVDSRSPSSWRKPVWRRYPAVIQVLDDEHAQLVGESVQASQVLESALRSASVRMPSATLTWDGPPEPAALHKRRIQSALTAIARGDLYQVNLARRFDFKISGGAFSLFQALERAGEAPFGMALNWGEHSLVSLSPELFLDAQSDGLVLTRPIKGTRPRSADAKQDLIFARELDASEKERAELAMVIDIERNDLGRLAIPGSVRMRREPQVVKYPTVLHREAEIEAQLESDTTWEALLTTMCPSGSVTGAPKISAMDLIAQLEASRRGLYTGALGYLSCSGRLRLSMAIRTLTLAQNRACYFSGGGIVADSDPAQEVEETLWKAEQLGALVKLGAALD